MPRLHLRFPGRHILLLERLPQFPDSELILDFDLVADGPVRIEVDYPGRTIWFNGFGQLESSGTTIAVKSGSVSLSMEGKRRYAVYLHNEGEQSASTMNLRFVAGGEVVHKASLHYEPTE